MLLCWLCVVPGRGVLLLQCRASNLKPLKQQSMQMTGAGRYTRTFQNKQKALLMIRKLSNHNINLGGITKIVVVSVASADNSPCLALQTESRQFVLHLSSLCCLLMHFSTFLYHTMRLVVFSLMFQRDASASVLNISSSFQSQIPYVSLIWHLMSYAVCLVN